MASGSPHGDAGTPDRSGQNQEDDVEGLLQSRQEIEDPIPGAGQVGYDQSHQRIDEQRRELEGEGDATGEHRHAQDEDEKLLVAAADPCQEVEQETRGPADHQREGKPLEAGAEIESQHGLGLHQAQCDLEGEKSHHRVDTRHVAEQLHHPRSAQAEFPVNQGQSGLGGAGSRGGQHQRSQKDGLPVAAEENLQDEVEGPEHHHHGADRLDEGHQDVARGEAEDLVQLQLNPEDQPDHAQSQTEQRRQAADGLLVEESDQLVAQRHADQNELGTGEKDEPGSSGELQADEGSAVADQGDDQEKCNTQGELQHLPGLSLRVVARRRSGLIAPVLARGRVCHVLWVGWRNRGAR